MSGAAVFQCLAQWADEETNKAAIALQEVPVRTRPFCLGGYRTAKDVAIPSWRLQTAQLLQGKLRVCGRYEQKQG
jgi:hypothetical protein